MATFVPNGFTPWNDLTTASPTDANTLQCPLNPQVSYFAGDIATMQLFQQFYQVQVYPTDNSILPQGYIYPLPMSAEIPDEAAGKLVLSSSKLGVFTYFEYTPLNSNIPITANNFIAGTPLAPNTTAYAYVVCSPSLLYSAQIKATTGVVPTYLYSQFFPNTDDYYAVTFQIEISSVDYEVTINFPLGDLTKGYYGTSLTYLNVDTSQPPQNPIMIPDAESSCLLMSMDDIDGSGFTSNSNTIANPWGIFALQYNRIVDNLNN